LEWADTLSQTIIEGIVQDTIDANSVHVRELLKKITDDDRAIEYAYVTNFEGNIFAHTFVGGFPKYLAELTKKHSNTLENSFVSFVYQTRKGKITEFDMPLLKGMVAHLHVGIIDTEINEIISHTIKDISYYTISFGLLGILLAWYFGNQISRPLTLFSNVVRRYGEGEGFNTDDIKSKGADIKQLVESFSSMVTMRSQFEDQIREREENLSLTLDSIGDAVIVTDNRGFVTRMNPIAEELTGWEINDALGRPLFNIFNIIDSINHIEAPNPVEKVIESGQVVDLASNTILISRQRNEYQISDSAAPINNQSGDIIGVILVFRDVTKEQTLQQDIRQSEKRLIMALKGTNAGLWDWNLEQDTAYYSSRWYEIYGLKSVERHTQNSVWEKMIYPDDLQKVKYLLTSYLDGEGDFYKSVHRIIDSQGKIHWVAEQGSITEYNESGKPKRLVGTIHDITDQHRHDEELRRSQKMDALGKLTGGVAHDFNNILSIILGFAELVKMEYGDDARLIESIDEISQAGLRGQKLTQNLLAFSRKKEAQAEKVNLNDLLRETETMLAKSITVRIDLQLKLEEGLWNTCIDSSDFKDTLLNLTLNAAHAITENGRIILNTSNILLSKSDAYPLNLPAGEYVVFSITDSGSGMNESIRSKIFDPFFTTKGDKGTGLGLSQVYGFIQRSNGAIKVYSKKGEGTRFTLYFPRMLGENIGKNITSELLNEQKYGHETILIVDDEPGMRKVASKILSRYGYQTIIADNGKAALDILANTKNIDLVLSDIIMPGINGYQLAKRIMRDYPDIQIQLASGYSDDKGKDEGLKDLENNILHKPYSTHELLNCVRTILDKQSI